MRHWISLDLNIPMWALTTRHPIRPTSSRCHFAWQPKPGRRSTYRRGDSVQTTGTSSGWAWITVLSRL